MQCNCSLTSKPVPVPTVNLVTSKPRVKFGGLGALQTTSYQIVRCGCQK